MNKQKILFFSLMFFFILSSCKKDDVQTDDKINDLMKNNMVINNNKTHLNNRLSLKDELIPIVDVNLPGVKSTSQKLAVDLTKNYAFKLKAEVNPPVYNGSTLQATHVSIKDNYAFVTYNTRGDDYLGGVEVFDVSNLRNPQLISQAIFPQADVSAVDYAHGKLYIVGATADFEKLDFPHPAFLQVLNLNSQMQIASVDTMLGISSFVATGVKVTQEAIFVTSGSNGHLSIFDLAYNKKNAHSIFDARSIALNNQKVFVLAGQPGRVMLFDRLSAAFQMSFATGGAQTPESKSEVAVNESYIFAALNEGGMKMLTMQGDLKQYIPKPVAPQGEPEEKHVTNSVTINNDLVLIGNGESGIFVGATIPQFNDSIVMLGVMQFGSSQSANFVQSRDSVIFVATGLGGLKIIGISIDEGVPGDIIPTEPCPTLLESIRTMFPETKNAMVLHPDLFAAGATTNILLKEETPVYVTFVWEGAGWKNTFGYYTYPADNPPASIQDIQHHIVFPNVSLVGEGGGLEPGDMVQLGSGSFPANTVIGFYLVAQGWKNGMTVKGAYTHYTNTEFNPNGTQQHLLFIESGCEDIVLTFEDIRLPDGDKDFNDIILVVKDNPNSLPNSRIDTTGIIRKGLK